MFPNCPVFLVVPLVSSPAASDANLVLGRVLSDSFPHIFGPREDEALDAAGARSAPRAGSARPGSARWAARRMPAMFTAHSFTFSDRPTPALLFWLVFESRAAMEAVTAEVNAHAAAAGQAAKSVDEVAVGFVRVANETMCRPIRALTQMKVGSVVWFGG